jgi:nitrous oxidase accessory protein NosD
MLTSSQTNTILRNVFINNNEGSTQALDDGLNNIFAFNYWSDWTTPDINKDFIVDQAYVIDGSANNQDANPLVIYVINHAQISIDGNADHYRWL